MKILTICLCALFSFPSVASADGRPKPMGSRRTNPKCPVYVIGETVEVTPDTLCKTQLRGAEQKCLVEVLKRVDELKDHVWTVTSVSMDDFDFDSLPSEGPHAILDKDSLLFLQLKDGVARYCVRTKRKTLTLLFYGRSWVHQAATGPKTE